MSEPESAADSERKPPRRHRRVDAPATGQDEAHGQTYQPEPRLEPKPGAATKKNQARKKTAKSDTKSGAQKLSERDRWLLDQRPPHWG